MGSTTIVTFLILILSSTLASSAGIFRWTDANGQVHFDDHPRDAAAKVVNITPTHTDEEAVQRLQRQQGVVQKLQEKRTRKKQQLAKDQEASDKKVAKCAKAQSRLSRLHRARYLYKPGENGERRVFSNLEREKATDKAQLETKRWC